MRQTDDFLHDLGGLLRDAAEREAQRERRRRPAIKVRASFALATVTAVVATAVTVAARPWAEPVGPETDATTTVVPSPDARPAPNEPTGPGLHDIRLTATAYGPSALRRETANRLEYVDGGRFTVSLTNRGENDEFDLKVTVRMRTSSGVAHTLRATVPQLPQRARTTVEVPLDRMPPIARALTVEADVAEVPGETARRDNSVRYPVLFGDGSVAERAVRDTASLPACRPAPPTTLTLVDDAPLPNLTAALPALAAPTADPEAVLARLPEGSGGAVLRSTARELSFPGDVHASVIVTAGPSQPLTDPIECGEARAARATALATGDARAAALAALADRTDVASDTQTLTVFYGKGRNGRAGAGMPLRPGSPVPTGIVGFGGPHRDGERVYAGIARPGATKIRVGARTIPVRDGFFAFARSGGEGPLRIEYLDATGRIIGR